MMRTLPLLGLQTLYISIALLVMGNGLQNIFLALRADIEGFPVTLIGTMASSYFVGFILGCIFCPRFVRGVGHIRTFASLASIAASTALIHSLWITPALWIALRPITGFCLAGLYVVIESWINEFSANQNRGRVISQYRIIDLVATISGQLFLLFVDVHDFRLFIVLAVMVTLSLVPISLTKVKSPLHLDDAPAIHFRETLKQVWKVSPLGLMGCLFAGVANASFWALSPIFVSDQLNSIKMIPLFVITYLAGGTLSQWPVGWLSDRRDRRHVLVLVSFFAVFASLLIVQSLQFTGVGRHLLWLGIFLFGACSIPIYSISIAHANDQSTSSNFLGMSSILLISNSIGAVCGPILISGIVQFWGSRSLFSAIGAVHLGLCLYCTYRLLVRRPVPESKRGKFFNIPRTTPTFFQLDPRSRRKPPTGTDGN